MENPTLESTARRDEDTHYRTIILIVRGVVKARQIASAGDPQPKTGGARPVGKQIRGKLEAHLRKLAELSGLHRNYTVGIERGLTVKVSDLLSALDADPETRTT